VIATDTLIGDVPSNDNNIEFLAAIEAHNYPIYGTMFHPEYQILDVLAEWEFHILNNQET
jgi:hypothetical protein